MKIKNIILLALLVQGCSIGLSLGVLIGPASAVQDVLARPDVLLKQMILDMIRRNDIQDAIDLYKVKVIIFFILLGHLYAVTQCFGALAQPGMAAIQHPGYLLKQIIIDMIRRNDIQDALELYQSSLQIQEIASDRGLQDLMLSLACQANEEGA